MKKIIKHIKRWNKWRKRCVNNKFHKLLVLLGVVQSPTFAFILTDEEEEILSESIKKVFKEGVDADERGNQQK